MSGLPNLVLVGFMASGKSTVGRRCARELGFRFHDSDELVERRAQMPVSRIFEEQGEEAFRTMEAAAIRDLARYRNVVIATGGGAVLNSANVAHLRRNGVIVLLWATPETILVRAGGRANRPLLADAAHPQTRIIEMMRAREPFYRSAAHVVVETTGLSRDDASELVLSAYRERAASWPKVSRPEPVT
jgi:shikimate kinase